MAKIKLNGKRLQEVEFKAFLNGVEVYNTGAYGLQHVLDGYYDTETLGTELVEGVENSLAEEAEEMSRVDFQW